MYSVASINRQETRVSRPGFVRFCYRPLAGCVVSYMIIKTITTCIAAATIALAAPAHADHGKTVCASMGNGITHAQQNCPQAPGGHQKALGTYDGYVLPQGYGGKP
jgi:hypothetical protein